MAAEPKLLRVRLNNIDTYRAQPTELDPQLPLTSEASFEPRVPIIRIFGTTEDGENICAHIHGAFPYLYITYPAGYDHHKLDTQFTAEKAQYHISRLRASIDRALASSGPERNKNRPTPDGKVPQSVATIALVKAVPFYGYQVGWRLYCKIYLYEPRQISRLAQLLLSGAILNRVLQPFESHLGYTHQFMIDHNLYGCNFVDVPINKVKWRKIHEDYEDEGEPLMLHNGHRIDKRKLLPPDKYLSHVYIGWEVDFRASDIWNVTRVQERPWHQDLKERDIPFDKDMKLVHSLRDLWIRHSNGEDIDSDAEYGAGLARPIWLNEPGYREAISDLVSYENQKRGPFTEEKIPRIIPAEEYIPTAYESIGYLASYYDRSVFATQMPTQFVRNDNAEEEEKDTVLVNWEAAAGVDVEEGDPDEVDYESVDEYELLGEKNYFQEQAEIDFEKEADLDEEEMQDLIAPRDAWVKTDFPPDIVGDPKEPRKYRPVSRDESPTRDKKRRKLRGPNQFQQQGAPLHEAQRPARNYYQGEKFSEQVRLLADKNRNLNEAISLEELENRVANHILPDLPKEEEKEISYQVVEKEYLEAALNQTNDEEQHDFRCLVDDIYDAFEIDLKRKVMIFNALPPTTAEVKGYLKGQIGQIHRKAFYGNPYDVPDRPFEFGGEFYRLGTTSVSKLPPFDPLGVKQDGDHSEPEEAGTIQGKNWVFAIPPPTYDEVMVEFEEIKKARMRGKIGGIFGSRKLPTQCSQLDGPTQEFPSQHKERQGFSFTQVEKAAVKKQKESGNMTVMSLEVHVNTRGDLWPDPEKDPIECIFWCLQASDEDEQRRMGILTLGDDATEEHIKRFFDVEVKAETTELGLFNLLTDLVRELDPDILAGWEVHSSSWGYIIQRAAHTLQMQLTDDFSRVKEYRGGRFGKDADPWGQKKSASMRVVGRHSINIWRMMRGELTINSYTQENVTLKLLNRRIPHYSHSHRTKWYMQDWKKYGRAKAYCRVLNYYFLRVRLDLDLLNKQDLITKISEQARIIGIDFNQVLSRGSQLKVESLMFRIAKPESYILISPSRKQVSSQHSIECKPLIMEPMSAFYTDPVIVLDFQSLYPSIMIGHNYCYSTCLGRIVDTREREDNRLGILNHYVRPDGILGIVEKDMVNISPTGMVFVKDTFRKSLLAKMLQEILDTRVMVKKRMKDKTISKTLMKKLDSWQKALKLIANVTYGYTSATFSGRMPCVEIADCIVQTGRETLEKAIKMIHKDESWGAHVVYGDTDSLFIHLPGKTKAQAFEIGYAIADRVTEMNPKPIRLKFEKVYHPCILMAMKRYVGYKYEEPDQVEPVWDAKGIETVRRDGTPAMQKIMKKSIELLFKTKDVSQVKTYVQSQWIKIMQEKVSLQDFCFGKEVKLGKYSEKGAIQPGVKVAYDRMKKDPRREPQYGERLPFVVIAGESKKIVDRAVEVEWLLHSDRLALDSTYYIRRKLIPPLSRVFNIVGSDVEAWYRETPKFQPLSKVVHTKGEEATQKEIDMAETRVQTLEMFMSKDGKSCPLCEETKPNEGHLLCTNCLSHRDRSFYEVQERLKTVEKSVIDLQEICRSCAGCSPVEEVPCDSTDCEVYYSRSRQNIKLKTYQSSSRNLIRELHKAEKKERKERQEMIDKLRVVDIENEMEYEST